MRRTQVILVLMLAGCVVGGLKVTPTVRPAPTITICPAYHRMEAGQCVPLEATETRRSVRKDVPDSY